MPGIDLREANWFAAAANGNFHGVRELAESGQVLDAVDETGQTAIHHAANGDHIHIVKELLMRGAQPAVQEKRWGGTPLHRAAINGNIAIALLLLAFGAPTDVQYIGGRWTPLHEAASHGHAEVCCQLVRMNSRPAQSSAACASARRSGALF